MKNKIFGKKGEEIALEFLEKKGYKIVEKNWYYHHKEIDIIALDNDELVIVEVKMRKTNYFGEPYEFVDKKKQMYLIEAANGYLIENNLDLPVRFDVISIVMQKNNITNIYHILDAFAP